MNYLPSLESLTKQTIITVVGLIVAGLIISKIPALNDAINPMKG
jgi:hypothetical protein